MTIITVKTEDTTIQYTLPEGLSVSDLYQIFDSIAIGIGYQIGSIKQYYYDETEHKVD